MAGVSVGFAKCFILFMAIVVLLQGLVYLGLSVWGLTRRDCNPVATDIAEEPFRFAMDLVYFSEQDCGNPDIKLQGSVYTLIMDWTKSYAITYREFVFMVTYATVSGLWIFTSLLVITTLCSPTTKVISGVIYWPWFISIICGCIVDVVATVFHAIDITKTLSLQDAFDYVGAEKPNMSELEWSLLETYGVYFSTPAILMTCLSCRVVLIWLLNIFGSSFCLSLSRILASQNAAKHKPASIAISQAPTRELTPQPQLAVVETVQQPMEQLPQANSQQWYAEQYPEQIRPRPVPIIIPAHNAELVQRQDSRMYKPSDRTTLQSPVVILPPQVPPSQASAPPQTPEQIADNNTYRTTEAHPDRLNYPPSDPVTPVRSPSPAVQQLAVTSPLNNRYSESFPPQSQMPANQRVSEELRNQMPWSYTSMVNKPPPPPRKPQQHVQIYPQIPEPDYIEH